MPFASPPIASASLPVKGDRIAFRGIESRFLIVAGCILGHLPTGDEARATRVNETWESRNLNVAVSPVSGKV